MGILKRRKTPAKKHSTKETPNWSPPSPSVHKNYRQIEDVTNFFINGRKGVTAVAVVFRNGQTAIGVARKEPGEKPNTKFAHMVAISDALDQYDPTFGLEPTAVRCRGKCC